MYQEEDRSEDIYIENLSKGYWLQKSGKYIHISRMTQWHLDAVEKLLNRVGDPYRFRSQIHKERVRRQIGGAE